MTTPIAIRRLLAAAPLAVLLAAVPARAQLDEGAGTVFPRDAYPTQELVRQPLTLSRGLLEVGLPVRFEISSDNSPGVADWSFPASLDYGLSDGLQIGVIHSTGICPGGSDADCDEFYDDVGGRVRLGLARFAPAGQLAVEARVLALDFDDTRWTGAVGLLYKRTLGPKLAVLAAADWTTYLNDRDDVAFSDAIAGALGLQLEIFPGLSVYGNVGVDFPFNENAGFDAKVAGPVSGGFELAPIHDLALGANVLFTNLVGEDGAGAAGFMPLDRFGAARQLSLLNRGRGDERSLTVYARIFL